MSLHRRVILSCCLTLTIPLIECTFRSKGPEQAVFRFVQAFNEKNVAGLLASIDPAQENLAHAVVNQLRDSGFPLEGLTRSLAGISQLLGNPVPDDWQVDEVHILDQKVDDDLAWINTSVNLSTRIRDVKHRETLAVKFALHEFPRIGWRIVDIHCAARK